MSESSSSSPALTTELAGNGDREISWRESGHRRATQGSRGGELLGGAAPLAEHTTIAAQPAGYKYRDRAREPEVATILGARRERIRGGGRRLVGSSGRRPHLYARQSYTAGTSGQRDALVVCRSALGGSGRHREHTIDNHNPRLNVEVLGVLAA